MDMANLSLSHKSKEYSVPISSANQILKPQIALLYRTYNKYIQKHEEEEEEEKDE